MLSYRRLVIRTAWKYYKERLFDGARHVIGFVVQTALLFGILFFVPWVGDIQSEARLAAAGVVSVLISAGLSFLWALFRAPEMIWQDLTTRVGDLERFIRPRFSVLLHNNGSPQRLGYGQTHRSGWTGSKQSVVTQQFNVLALDVRNETATALHACEAYLSHISEVGGEPGVFQSLRLQWVPVGDEVSTVTIPSGGHRTVILFQVVGNQVAFSHDQMPIQAVHLLKEEGYYHGTVALSAKNTTSSHVGFRLDCTKGEAPHLTLVRQGFQEADSIGWAPETAIGF